MTSLHFLTFTFWNSYVLKLLRLETITFSDATLSDVDVVLCYVLSQYHAGCCAEPAVAVNGVKDPVTTVAAAIDAIVEKIASADSTTPAAQTPEVDTLEITCLLLWD